CCGGGAVPTETSNSRDKIIFKGKDSFSDAENADLKQEFHSFRAPSLVYMNGVVVATVEAHYINNTDQKSCVSIAAKSMKSNGGKWTEGTAIVFDHYDVNIDRLLSPTTLVKDNDYETTALVGGYGASTTPLTELGDKYWMPRMADGEVKNGRKETENKQFEWQSRSTSEVPYFFWEGNSTNRNRFKQFLGGGGAGIKMDDGPYVLPIQAVKNDGTKVSLVILAKRTTDRWEFSKDTSPAGCIQPAVLEWKEKELLM
ncbi:trans-sialidase, putative, partial [Trypanosoma cruzi marinkellei]